MRGAALTAFLAVNGFAAKWTVRKSNWTASARFNDVAGYLGPSLDGALTETTVLPVTEHDEMVDAALLTAKVSRLRGVV